jgi:hypothetical protein
VTSAKAKQKWASKTISRAAAKPLTDPAKTKDEKPEQKQMDRPQDETPKNPDDANEGARASDAAAAGVVAAARAERRAQKQLRKEARQREEATRQEAGRLERIRNELWMELARDPWKPQWASMGEERVERQAAAAWRAWQAGLWPSQEAFADFLSDWASAEDAWARWPQPQVQFLAQNGADPFRCGANALLVGGARMGRLDWMAAGWKKAVAMERGGLEGDLAGAVGGEPTKSLAADDPRLWSLTREEPEAARASEKSPMASGWRWERPWREREEAARGVFGAAPDPAWRGSRPRQEQGKSERVWLLKTGAGSGAAHGAEHLAQRAAFVAARAGQAKAIELLGEIALPWEKWRDFWHAAIDAAAHARRPRVAGAIAKKIDPAPACEADALRLMEDRENDIKGPGWSNALRATLEGGLASDVAHLLAIWRASGGANLSAQTQANWLAAGSDPLDSLVAKPPREAAAKAQKLLGAGWSWRRSRAIDTALMASMKKPYGMGWPGVREGLLAMQAFGIKLDGVEGAAAAAVARSSSPAAMEWAIERGLDFNAPAEIGPMRGKTAAELARERLGPRQLVAYRSGEPEALAQLVAVADRQALARELERAASAAMEAKGERDGPTAQGAPAPGAEEAAHGGQESARRDTRGKPSNGRRL